MSIVNANAQTQQVQAQDQDQTQLDRLADKILACTARGGDFQACVGRVEAHMPALTRARFPAGLRWHEYALRFIERERSLPRFLAEAVALLEALLDGDPVAEAKVAKGKPAVAKDEVVAKAKPAVAKDEVVAKAKPVAEVKAKAKPVAEASYRQIDTLLGEFSPSALRESSSRPMGRRERLLLILRSLVWKERVKPGLFRKGIDADAFRAAADWQYFDSQGRPIPNPNKSLPEEQRWIRWDEDSVIQFYKSQWDLFAARWDEATAALVSVESVLDWAFVCWEIGPQRLLYLLEQRERERFNR